MRTTPNSFFEHFVYPNYCDYTEQSHDIRLGFNASVSAFQLGDIFYEFYKREKPEIIESWPKIKFLHRHLSTIEPLYLTIQSVATAYKHLYPRAKHHVVGSPGSLSVLAIPNEGIVVGSSWRQNESDVLVRQRDGTKVSLSLALRKVVKEMWPAILPDEA